MRRRVKDSTFWTRGARLLDDPGLWEPERQGKAGHMDPLQDDLPDPMVAVRLSENQNSLHAATASSKTSGKALFNTAQHKSATDAETSWAQTSPPGGQEAHAPVQKDQSNESTDDKDDTTAKVMSQTSKIIEPASLAESDARTIAHIRHRARRACTCDRGRAPQSQLQVDPPTGPERGRST